MSLGLCRCEHCRNEKSIENKFWILSSYNYDCNYHTSNRQDVINHRKLSSEMKTKGMLYN